MKSSVPVFTRQNPFQSASREGKAHYHPSQKQSVTKKKKKTALSPVRLKQRPAPEIHTLSPESQQPFDKCDHRFAAYDGQPVYAELWPSSDCGSTRASSTTSSDMETLKKFATASKSTVSSELGVQEDSVLAKYIERFRHGRPQSREERQQTASAIGEEQLPFWWMSPSSLPTSSTPTKATDNDFIQPLKDDRRPAIFSPPGEHQHDRTLSPCRASLTICSDTSQGEFDDTEIFHLQEKASRLLLRGECPLSDGSIPVSSEGLGCSDFSSPISVDEPVRSPLIPSLTLFTTVKASSDSVPAASTQKSVIPTLVTPIRPEEDILFQWRLRRKMEQARDWPQSIRHSSLPCPTFSWQTHSLSHSSASGQAYKQQHSTQPPGFSQKATHLNITAPQQEPTEAHGSYPTAAGPPPFPNIVVPGSSVSQPQTIAHVPAHMHLLCDVLPCPIQPSSASVQQNISQTSDESPAKVVYEKTKVPGNLPASSPPAPSGGIEGERPRHQERSEKNRKEKALTKKSEKDEKKDAESIRKQKKKPRYTVNSEYPEEHSSTKRSSSHQRLPWAEQHQQQGNEEFPSERCTAEHVPSSPIHSALGQVVSEVLFPVDSSPTQKTPVSLVSRPSNASVPAQSPVPPCSAENSVEVISQLLQEAEDSDEKDFEDDPLLQVLRKQRKWIKEQISEVDSMLNEFLNKQQVTSPLGGGT